MHAPHLRPDRARPVLMNGTIPAEQARALHRRRTLEAQQRAFREVEATSPADLAPVRRRVVVDRPNG